jgi:hypothetical protein
MSVPTNGWAEDMDTSDKSLSRRFAGTKALTAAATESFDLSSGTSGAYVVGGWILNPANTPSSAAPPAGQPFLSRLRGVPGMSPNRPRFGRGW